MPSLGVAMLGAVVVGSVVLWASARPGGQPDGRYLGEFFGAEAVLLFSCSLVLATLLRGIERAFGGLDRVAQWHRHTAVAAVILVVIHPSFAGSAPVPDASVMGLRLGDVALIGLPALAVWSLAPSLRAAKWSRLVRHLARISHEHWLTGHRLTGLFVAAAVVHGLLVDPVLKVSAPLKAGYLVAGGLGIAAYVYRELFARFVVPVYDYTVADVQRPNEMTVDVFLQPVGRPLNFEPGQFVFLAFGGVDGWQRHPFSVASAPTQQRLEVSVRAVGDYTRDLRDKLKPGTPAKAAGPFGGFDYRGGGKQQIWIAGGIGVTPFMSWIRALDEGFDRDVAFFYSVASEADALYLDEIGAAAAAHPTLRPHVVDSGRDGYLTAEQAAFGIVGEAGVWVYMCGPPAMMSALSRGFRKLGIPASQIRWEQFNVR
ncbi:MAG: ferredoxin reductase family protein [Streptosporangiaceae bacterium]|jgi:predicted ferric reductase